MKRKGIFFFVPTIVYTYIHYFPIFLFYSVQL